MSIMRAFERDCWQIWGKKLIHGDKYRRKVCFKNAGGKSVFGSESNI